MFVVEAVGYGVTRTVKLDDLRPRADAALEEEASMGAGMGAEEGMGGEGMGEEEECAVHRMGVGGAEEAAEAAEGMEVAVLVNVDQLVDRALAEADGYEAEAASKELAARGASEVAAAAEEAELQGTSPPQLSAQRTQRAGVMDQLVSMQQPPHADASTAAAAVGEGSDTAREGSAAAGELTGEAVVTPAAAPAIAKTIDSKPLKPKAGMRIELTGSLPHKLGTVSMQTGSNRCIGSRLVCFGFQRHDLPMLHPACSDSSAARLPPSVPSVSSVPYVGRWCPRTS